MPPLVFLIWHEVGDALLVLLYGSRTDASTGTRRRTGIAIKNVIEEHKDVLRRDLF
jgi:hypothetical protein